MAKGSDTMLSDIRRRICVILTIVVVMTLIGCGGGGGGGGEKNNKINFNGGSWESDFFLEDVFFGRPLRDARGQAREIVNPASYIELDPISGFLLPDYPKTLYGNDTLDNIFSLNLVDTSSQPFKPKILPRNAALLVDFSKTVDAASLNLDAGGFLTANSPVQIVDNQGRLMSVQVTVLDDRLLLNPSTGDQLGFPASPVLFDENGVPVANEQGYLKLVLYSIKTGPNVLKSTGGSSLGARTDYLGSPIKPIDFNPGNRLLDFISFGDMTFNGFLPDLTPPRIIREVNARGTVDGLSFNGNELVIQDSTASFNVTANSGHGEWSLAILTVRPGHATLEALVRVTCNTATELSVNYSDPTVFSAGLPRVGDDYLVQRAEYFEPIPGFDRPETAVDPIHHPKDPKDPEDTFNSELIYFLKFDEWNDNGWDPITYSYAANPDNPIEADWRIGILFSEPMDVDSFRPYESYYVADDIGDITDPLFSAMNLGRVTASNRQTKIYFEPIHTDQFGLLGGDRFRGFGNVAKDLRLVIRSVPSQAQVDAFYMSLGEPSTWPPEVVGDLEDEGVLGIIDLGGQSLGMPAQFFDKADPFCIINAGSLGRGAFPPAVDFQVKLSSSGGAQLEETGIVTHRFMGLPETAGDPTTGITGVVYRDHDDGDDTHADNEIYGPHVADVHLGLSGFLSGHPVEFIEHVFDDFNPPAPSSPSYPDPISKTPFGVGAPINGKDGARFQQIYRRGDCSPDVPSFAGTILDLVGLSWSPIGGNVTRTYIKEFSIAMALSSLGIDQHAGSITYDEPDTRESGGIPRDPESGLRRKFDSRRGTWGPNPDENYKEEHPPIENSNVSDSDGDGSVRDEWQIVLGDDIDITKLHAEPVEQYTDGRPYTIDQANVYAPKNQGSKFNYFIPYPDFDNPKENPGFGYDSSRGLLIELRTDDNGDTPVARTNGYSFHVGIQSSMLPRFRVYAMAPAPSGSRPSIYAATDPFDEINPPLNQFQQPDDTWSWNWAWTGMQPAPADYGDNSRYFMIFNYAKRISTIESPLIRVRPTTLDTPEYLAPIIAPDITEVPVGTNLDIWFRASSDDVGTIVTDWVRAEEIDSLNGSAMPYIQFKATFEANLDSGDVPVIDTLIIPYKR